MDETRDWGRLASLLLEAAGDSVAARGRPTWVQVLDPPDGDQDGGFSLAFSEAPEGFMGWVAADDCRAVGMIGTGRLRPVTGSTSDLATAHIHGVRMVCLVARDGAVAWKMAGADGSPPGGPMLDTPPSEGRLLDCLRRCFGLPTPPPPVSPIRLQVIVWLVAVLDHAAGARRRLSWSEVARLHPLARVLASELGGLGSEFRAGLVRVAGAAWSWEDIRMQAQQPGFLDDIVDPTLAGWMDEGMFARWVLSDLPSADELFAAVRPLLSPTATRRLAHAVHAAAVTEPAVVT